MDNLGKDIRTVASGVVGVSDSAEVYAVKVDAETVSVSLPLVHYNYPVAVALSCDKAFSSC